jgi:hypothetical protein
VFSSAIIAYTRGEWADAKAKAEEALTLKVEDGPSMTLLDTMRRTDFQAPADWQGFRALTEK